MHQETRYHFGRFSFLTRARNQVLLSKMCALCLNDVIIFVKIKSVVVSQKFYNRSCSPSLGPSLSENITFCARMYFELNFSIVCPQRGWYFGILHFYSFIFIECKSCFYQYFVSGCVPSPRLPSGALLRVEFWVNKMKWSFVVRSSYWSSRNSLSVFDYFVSLLSLNTSSCLSN